MKEGRLEWVKERERRDGKGELGLRHPTPAFTVPAVFQRPAPPRQIYPLRLKPTGSERLRYSGLHLPTAKIPIMDIIELNTNAAFKSPGKRLGDREAVEAKQVWTVERGRH